MKKITFLFISLLFALSVITFTACSDPHEHSYATEWSSDAENHWHDSTCKHKEEKSDLAAHTYTNACDTACDVCGYTRTVGDHVYDNACDTACNVCGATREITHAHGTTLTAGDTTHYYACSVCGDKKDEAAHVFDKTVASSEYLKAAATATTKAQYYKSCVCGKASATEYFETDKTAGTLANVQDLSKTYDKVELANPTYETNSDGAVTIEWYQGGTKLDAKPVNAGTYKVKVIIAESATYTGISAEKEFVIAKKVISDLEAEFVYNGSAVHTSPTLVTSNGVVAGDNDVVVKATFANKSAGASVTGAVLESASGAHNNYELDLSTCTASIVPKVLNNVTYNFTYNGNDYQQIVLTSANHSGILGSDHVTLEVCFATPNVGASLDTSEETGFEPGFLEENYVLGENYNFSIVQKPLNVPTLSKDYNGNNTVSYAFTATDGLVSGDSCTLNFNVTPTAVGHYEDVAMTGISLTNTNYKIEVSTCDLHILDANDLVMLVTNKYNSEGDYILVVEIKQGTVRVGDSIVKYDTPDKDYEVLAIEKFNKPLEFATVGDEVGLYVSNMTDLAEIPGASFLYELDNVPEMATEFLADIYMLPTDEGGRQTPVFNNYKPNLVGLGASQQVNITLIDVYESEEDTMLSPGGTAFVKITLENPLPACLLETTTFKLYEGTKYVGNAENIELIVYDSFAKALVVDCDTAHSETMEVYAGQKVYVKMKLHEIDTQQEVDAVLSTFSIKATPGSAATFTWESYKNNTTTAEQTATTPTAEVSMLDLTCWEDGDYFYYVITCVTAGEISITVE